MSSRMQMQDDAETISALTPFQRRYDAHRVRKVHKFQTAQEGWSENDVRAFTLVVHAISCKGCSEPVCFYTKQLLRHICVCPTCGDCQLCTRPVQEAGPGKQRRQARIRDSSMFAQPSMPVPAWTVQISTIISTLVALVITGLLV